MIPPESAAAVPTDRPRAARWLLFIHQIPAKASNARVRTWRRLQQLGALAVKQAVYVLPDTPSAREAVEWLKAELEEAGGEVTLFSADTVDTWSNDALIAEFRRARQADYAALAREMTPLVRRLEDAKRRSGLAGRTRPGCSGDSGSASPPSSASTTSGAVAVTRSSACSRGSSDAWRPWRRFALAPHPSRTRGTSIVADSG